MKKSNLKNGTIVQFRNLDKGIEKELGYSVKVVK